MKPHFYDKFSSSIDCVSGVSRLRDGASSFASAPLAVGQTRKYRIYTVVLLVVSYLSRCSIIV